MRKRLTTLLSLAMLLMLTSNPVSALTKEGDVYKIGSADEYDTFRQLVATGNPYANAVLTDDIVVSSSIGTGDIQFHYRGTFDGQGHTIEMRNLTNNADSVVGLFQYTEPGCVIKNLKVKGVIVASKAKNVGSLIGSATGTKIENCLCTDTIKYAGTGCAGGLVGISYGETFFENCAFKGKLNAQQAKACYGFVGENVHMVSLKSNYVAAIFNVGNDTKTGQFMEVAKEKSQTILNNYAYHEVFVGDTQPTDNIVDAPNGFAETVSIRDKEEVVVKTVSAEDINHGKVCYDLNVKGRNGVVWYMDDLYTPSPFKEVGSTMGVKKDGEVHLYIECGDHSYEGNICQKCGNVNGSVEPLQKRGIIEDNKVTIGYLRYKINKDSNLHTAELIRDEEEEEKDIRYEYTAAHIPETINVDGEVYRVDYIAQYAFNGSNIQYVYIGKNVNHIEKDVFNNCKKLKYVHIADCPDNGKKEERLLTEKDADGDKPLFYLCPLETVYIGRNIRWDPSNFSPFQSTYSFTPDKHYERVLFGPLVTRVGNYNDDDPEDGWYDELFDDSSIQEYYFMGDDGCLDRKLLIGCTEGFERSTKAYINRTFDDNNAYIDNIQMSDQALVYNSIYDSTGDIIYGPYIKKIVNNSFSRPDGTNMMPATVDFTNAFNLEEIEDDAFNDCDETHFIGAFENTKLKTIGKKAFYDCDNLKKIVIPGTVTKIDEATFKDIDGISLTLKYGDTSLMIGKEAFFDNEDLFASIYYGRNLEYKEGCPFKAGKLLGTIVIAPEIAELPKGLFSNIPKLGALTFAHSDTPLKLNADFGEVFSFSDGISSMYINREIREQIADGTVKGWGSAVKESLHDLTLGISLVEDDFSNFKALQTIIIGDNVREISKETFKGCTGLKTVFAISDIDIKESAFEGCTALEQVFRLGKDLKLQDNAFADCNNIYQVMVGLTKDPERNYSESAFHNDVYGRANLVSAGDKNHKKVVFTKEPWSLFQNRNIILPSDDYEYGYAAEYGDYEHAYMDHHFDKGKYEMVYLPFDMDSYSFGSDAEIYKLDEKDGTYDSNSEVAFDRYNMVNVHFRRQNLDETKTLDRGLYIVKTKHEIETLESHPNFFESRTISVDNRKQTYGGESLPDIVVNEEDKTLGVDDNAYIYEDGVIKHVANNVNTIPNSVTLYKTNLTDSKEQVFNLVNDKSEVLISLNTNLGFSEHLEGYSSFYDADYTYKVPDWCEVYVVTQSNSDGSLVLKTIEDRIINKGQAVLIKSIDGVPAGLKEYLTHTTKESTDPLYDDNMLMGVSVDTPVYKLADEGFVYVLSCNSSYQNTGFYKLSDNRLMPAGKAYIPPYLINAADKTKTCLFVFNDNTVTGIDHAADNTKAGNSIYDLMGRSLKQAGFKGIYIINGKKVVVK